MTKFFIIWKKKKETKHIHREREKKLGNGRSFNESIRDVDSMEVGKLGKWQKENSQRKREKIDRNG